MATQLLPLFLSAKALKTRDQDENSESADAGYQMVRPRILERDNHSCRFCGFRDNKGGRYIQVHHRDDDHHNNNPDNLVTACFHCHAVFHIGRWGALKEAVLIDLPEIEQWQLSHLVRSILVAQHFPAFLSNIPGTPREKLDEAKRKADAATALMARLKARETQAEDIFMTSDPQDFANALHLLPLDVYERREERVRSLKLLMLGRHVDRGVDIMPGIVHGWLERGKDRVGPYSGFRPGEWSSLAGSAR